MKKLIDYLNKNNINYKIVSIGENYFNNAPALHFDAVQITVYYDRFNDYNKQAADKKTAERYINRYNKKYCKFSGWFTGSYDTIIITTTAAAAAIRLYQAYSTPAHNDCEALMHRYYTEPLIINLNNELKKIMFKYGAQYNAAIMQAATA
jgi:hypothetical protein